MPIDIALELYKNLCRVIYEDDPKNTGPLGLIGGLACEGHFGVSSRCYKVLRFCSSC